MDCAAVSRRSPAALLAGGLGLVPLPQSVQAFYNAHIEENFPTNSLVATRVAVPASVTYLVFAALDISIAIAFGLWALGLKGLAALGAIAVARRTIKVC